MKKRSKPSSYYLKYTGLAFQMFFSLLLGWYLGSLGDRYFGFPKPYIALSVSILFLIVLFVKLYKDVVQNKI